jgi:hypothetical protein
MDGQKEEKSTSKTASNNIITTNNINDAIFSPYDNFVYALNSRDAKRQYPSRLDRFLTFIGLVRFPEVTFFKEDKLRIC